MLLYNVIVFDKRNPDVACWKKYKWSIYFIFALSLSGLYDQQNNLANA